MANKSIKDAFQRFWQHCVSSFATKEYVDNVVENDGDFTSWNDLTDKPFGEVIRNDTLIINEDVFNTATEDQQFQWYVRISDTPIDISDFAEGATFVYDNGYMSQESYDEILERYNTAGSIEAGAVMIIPYDNFTFGPHPNFTGMTLNKKGIYVGSAGRLTINGYSGFDDTIEVEQIDRKYIPTSTVIFSDAQEADKVHDGTYKFEDTVIVTDIHGDTRVLYPTRYDPNNNDRYTYSTLPFMKDGKWIVYQQDSPMSGGNTGELGEKTIYLAENVSYNPLATETYVDNAVATAIGNAIGGSY